MGADARHSPPLSCSGLWRPNFFNEKEIEPNITKIVVLCIFPNMDLENDQPVV
jgi:hypothetical protein